MRFMARPTTLGILPARPAVHPAAPQRRWPPVSCRWNSARISAARCGRQLISAASSHTSRASIWSNLAHLWMASERLLGRSCDPLDEELIALMERDLG